jgi:hypothetical protein
VREIKFRAKLCGTDTWVYGGGVYQYAHGTLLLSEDEESPIVHRVDPDTVGQKMDIPDCKGKEVYEGDILVREFFSDWCVIWKNTGFQIFNICNPNVHFPVTDLADREVIGNIHDNPGLLEV